MRQSTTKPKHRVTQRSDRQFTCSNQTQQIHTGSLSSISRIVQNETTERNRKLHTHLPQRHHTSRPHSSPLAYITSPQNKNKTKQNKSTPIFSHSFLPPAPVSDGKRPVEAGNRRHPPIVRIRPHRRRPRHDPGHHSSPSSRTAAATTPP